MGNFTIKMYSRVRCNEDDGHSFQTLSHITTADYIETCSGPSGQFVKGFMNNGSVSFVETVPHADTSDDCMEFDKPYIKFVVIENMHGKTTQTIRADNTLKGS